MGREDQDRPSEFWQEARQSSRGEMRKFAIRWAIAFALLIGGMFFVLWRSSSAVHYGSSRVESRSAATYKVTGRVVDPAGKEIPWAKISDDPSGRPPLFEAAADRYGRFELFTLPEPHALVVTSLGFRPGRVEVGKRWYLWMPSGAEDIAVTLQPE